MRMVYLRLASLEHALPGAASSWAARSVGRGGLDQGPHRGSRLALLREWRRRRRSRMVLSQLDGHNLKDIGLTYAEAEHEANKPFWLP